jgi:hypothetical protein
MALLVNNLPRAIAGIMEGINDGIEDIGSIVSNVIARPPEKVVFNMDAIVALNSLERVEIRVSEPTVKTIVATNVVETVSVNGNTTGLSPLPLITTNTTVETTFGGEVRRTTHEDQAAGVVFEYPGVKSS